MSNEKFKVKFGLAVGDTVATVDGTTGDIVTAGDVAVNGGDLTTTQTTANLFNATATTVNIGNGATTEVNLGNTGTGQVQIKSPVIIGANTTQTVFNTVATTVNAFGAATTISIGANTGTTTINNSLVADDISVTTVDTTNLEVTNIKAKDGTAAATIADTTGIITVSTQLNVDNLNFNGNTIISTDTNGSITLDPNGTGNVVLTFANGGNLTNDRNYVFGAIRNATTAAAGDIWALNVSASSNPTRGISIDNSSDTAKIASYVARTYGAAAGNRSRLVFERARGTAASPTAVQSGDFLGEFDVTGYSSTGWINDTLTAVPGFFGFTATENWVSNTALGTTFALSLAPTTTTITTNANLVACLAITPQVFASRSDAFTWANGKTGTTQTMALDVSGNLTVTGDIRINGNDIQNSGGTAAITLSSANATTTIKGDAITLENNAGTDYLLLNSTSATFAQPVGFPVKTAAQWNAITGAVGRQVCVSDSAGGGNPNGMMAFWDTTNARWSYIHDNTAV